MSINQINLLGRLVRDPEVTYTNSGLAICNITVAVDRPKKAGEAKAETDFIDCVAFGKQGEVVGNYFAKGNRIFVGGRLQIESFTDKQGQKRTKARVVLNSFEFIDPKGNGGYAGGGAGPQKGRSNFDSFGEESLDF